VNKLVYGSEIDIGGVRASHHLLPVPRDPSARNAATSSSSAIRTTPSRDFIKRCVAVEGQTVEIRDKVLFVDGKAQVEPYIIHSDDRVLPKEISARDNFGPTVVPKGHLFMMGDNRDNSHDSRFWGPWRSTSSRGRR